MLRFAFRNLLSRPARSCLSLIGLTVAIMGMIGLFSVARGMESIVTDTFRRITGLVAMQPGSPIPLFSRLPASWEKDIAKVPGVRVVTPEVWVRANLMEGKTVVSPPRFLFGVDIPSRLRLKGSVYQSDIIKGRFLRAGDVGTLNAVISLPIAQETRKTVGETINVNDYELNIVGIYSCNSMLLDVAIILDLAEVRKMSRFGNDSVCAFYIEQTGEVSDRQLAASIKNAFYGRDNDAGLPSSSDAAAAAPAGNGLVNSLTRLLGSMGSPTTTKARPSAGENVRGRAAPGRRRANNGFRGLKGPLKPFPIEIRSPADWGAHLEEFTSDLNVVLAVLSGIGVTIAVLSIVNTMLMSVAERIIEFGVLKANGWSGYSVLKLVTAESALLGFCGGILGAAAGYGATIGINSVWPTRIYLVASPGLLSFGLGFSTALGILGGLYPAIWAMRMMPMDAIRRG